MPLSQFQRELAAMGYKFQFITLAGVHNMWYHMFELATTMLVTICQRTFVCSNKNLMPQKKVIRSWLTNKKSVLATLIHSLMRFKAAAHLSPH